VIVDRPGRRSPAHRLLGRQDRRARRAASLRRSLYCPAL